MHTLAFYGPHHAIASKLVVAIIRDPDGEATSMKQWFLENEEDTSVLS